VGWGCSARCDGVDLLRFHLHCLPGLSVVERVGEATLSRLTEDAGPAGGLNRSSHHFDADLDAIRLELTPPITADHERDGVEPRPREPRDVEAHGSPQRVVR
jgi:hypothetical protein